MPTTKSLTIQNERNLQRAIKYILNPEKTMGQTLTSGYKINYVNNADFEMKLTRKMARLALGQSNKKSDQEVVARHIIQSFDPNDNLTPEEIHEIG
ncbi:relaxase/mobilization nuclease domain-containing protein, partial [Lactococcus lactis]